MLESSVCDEVGNTIEYRKCLCTFPQQDDGGISPDLLAGREVHDEMGEKGERGEGRPCDMTCEILGWKHGAVQLGMQQEISMQDHETLVMVTTKTRSCL